MSQAAKSYSENVQKQAAEMGLDQDPKVMAMMKETEELVKKLNPNESIGGVESSTEKDDLDFASQFLDKIIQKTTVKAETEEDPDDDQRAEKIGFRDRKIIEYENRIRHYSTPDKVFRYFATYKVVDERGVSEVMMTPQDFLRSISPGVKQPEHLGLDQFMLVNAGELEGILSQKLDLPPESIFYQLGSF